MKAVFKNKIVEFNGADSLHLLINLRSTSCKTLHKYDVLTEDKFCGVLICNIMDWTLEEYSGWGQLTEVSLKDAERFARDYDLERAKVEFYRTCYYTTADSTYPAYTHEKHIYYWEEIEAQYCCGTLYDEDNMIIVDGWYKMGCRVWERILQLKENYDE